MQDGVDTTVEHRVGHNLAGIVREAAGEVDPQLLLLAWRRGHGPSATADEVALRDVLIDVPCDLAVLSIDGEARTPRRVLLAAEEEHGALALDLAFALSDDYDGHLTMLSVLDADATTDEVSAAHDASRTEVEERRGARTPEARVVRSDRADRAILQEADPDDFDLLVVGAPPDGIIHRIALGTVPERVARNARLPVLVAKRRPTGARSWLGRGWDRVARTFPQLDEAEKAEVYRDLRRSARGGTDFYVMMALAGLIAALGLLLASPAVVIGAMLVAPLMLPTVSLGLGVVHGDVRVLQLSAMTLFRGALSALLVGVVAGALVPGAEVTSEVTARTQPSLLDLGVALGGGAAGAYATARPSLSASLPGVAIAVALVPPLAAGGIALALGSPSEVGGAGLLFVTNLIAIAAAAGIVFLLLGFRPEPLRASRVQVFGRGFVALLLLTIAVAIPLGALTAGSVREASLDADVRAALDATFPAVPGLAWNEVSVDRLEDRALALTVEAESTETLSPEVVLALEVDLSQRLERPVRLVVRVVQVSILGPLEQTTPAPEPEEPEEGGAAGAGAGR
ncbi:MAG: DUF389 domain-containing protein [Dehalococcoidia bacterium]|nr:DUF389 domain-containing protein [Dehalococcoidia bacterium]